jgi:hypothetical protein
MSDDNKTFEELNKRFNESLDEDKEREQQQLETLEEDLGLLREESSWFLERVKQCVDWYNHKADELNYGEDMLDIAERVEQRKDPYYTYRESGYDHATKSRTLYNYNILHTYIGSDSSFKIHIPYYLDHSDSSEGTVYRLIVDYEDRTNKAYTEHRMYRGKKGVEMGLTFVESLIDTLQEILIARVKAEFKTNRKDSS